MSENAASAGVAQRGPGRPRVAGHDERILDAVVQLIDEGQQVTVSAVVDRSGVSRAALYRRWPSIADLTAAALDRGRAALEIDMSVDIRDAIAAAYFGALRSARGATYSERRFRTRLVLVMQNPDLQRAYWKAHARRRRAGVVAALEEAVRRGELRADTDIEAAIDAINGVFYYQIVVRGSRFDDPAATARCRAAFDIIWRGMAP